ncbi:MAG: Gldg family protein [Thiogranum sp.]|nr:Gldg family protein [Thiogranum sp.]
MRERILNIARREFAAFFTSPVAFIFFGTFLAVNLFIFFWVETFFARNIADVRPLFEWMPVLLIFLVSALSMRMWSEERRSGTLEFLLTAPVRPSAYVLGKFFAGMGLVAIALALTLPLPVTVSLIGPLDWGPVFGAYVASLLLAGAYLAIGLFVSARSDNQIVSLIVSVAICGVFYLLGSDALTSLFGNQAGEVLKLLGSGSRFESITRGVLDLRDLYYYLSIIGVFLMLNLYTLERLRWAADAHATGHRRWGWLAVLMIANMLAGNLWLAPIGGARADITQGHVYSISPATRGYLAQLREPLLIRGYFSAKTHPLLAPLVPQLKNLLKEYQVAGHGKVRVEFIDPLENPQLEREAVEKFGIQPVPFQTASKYQASVVNSYFDVVVQYGDQFEKLGFRDLIEVKAKDETDLDVELKDPEYDVTSAIRKVLYSYQGSGKLFEQIDHPVVFHGYFSADKTLPDQLVDARKKLKGVLDNLTRASAGKLKVDIQDPGADGGTLAGKLTQQYGFRPMVLSLLDSRSFWFYMVLESNGQTVQVPLPDKLDAAGFKRAVDAGLKHFATGFLKSVAIDTPAPAPSMSGLGMGAMGSGFTQLRDRLKDNVRLINTDLKAGEVPADADLLLLVAPENLDRKQLFAVDQFLMRGGTVILASSAFNVQTEGELAARKQTSGLEGWLAHNGLVIQPDMVLDPQNAAFPVPAQRNVAGFTVRETELVNYPYFVDVRGDGLGGKLTAGLNQVTLNWASPIKVDDAKKTGRRVTRLLESSQQAWNSDSTQLQPDFRRYGKLGFPAGEQRGRQLLGVEVTGQFESFFKGQPSPLVQVGDVNKPQTDKAGGKATESAGKPAAAKPEPVISRVIDKSPESARIILLASNSFLGDTAIDLASVVSRSHYTNSVQLVENAIDWSLEDRGLLALRGRAHFNRTLRPLSQQAQVFWEYLNYGLAVLGLVFVWLLHRRRDVRRRAHYQTILQGGAGA